MYNMTALEAVTKPVDMLKAVNTDLFMGLFGVFMLIAFFVIMYVVLSRYANPEKSVACFFVTMIASWIMSIIGLTGITTVYVCLVLFIISTIMLFFE